MLNRLWIISGLVTAVSLFAGGYWLGNSGHIFGQNSGQTTTQSSSVIEKKLSRDEARHLVTDRVQTVTQPNGAVTVTKEHVTEASSNVMTEVGREKAQETTKVTQANLPNYSLGFTYRIQDKAYGASVGRRLVGPLWLEGHLTQKLEMQIGVRVEF